MTDKLSRRDFLKLASAGSLAIAFGDNINALDKANIAVEQERSFETDNAIYIPFFENHTIRITDERIINAKPDCLFVEFGEKSEVLFTYTPVGILYAKTKVVLDSVFSEAVDVDTGRLLSDGLIQSLSDNSSTVSVEGLILPYTLEKRADAIKLTTNAVPASAIFASMSFALLKVLNGKDLGKEDLTRIMAFTLASLWASSDEMASLALLSSYSTHKDSPQIRNIQNIAGRINASITLTHPEDIIIFMRNIFMSLKLMTLADQKPKDHEGKIKIAFRIGAGHGAVSDMVKLGKDITLALLDVYSDDIFETSY